MTGYNFQKKKKIVSLSLKIDLVLSNSTDPDEMQHYAAFHHGLHCLPKYLFRGFQSTKVTLFIPEIIWTLNTQDRWQSKTLLTIDKCGSKSLETKFLIAIWQSKTLFLTFFDLRRSIVLTFLIAAYQVC